MIVDSSGKLFGKINIFDLLVLISLIIVVGTFASRKSFERIKHNFRQEILASCPKCICPDIKCPKCPECICPDIKCPECICPECLPCIYSLCPECPKPKKCPACPKCPKCPKCPTVKDEDVWKEFLYRKYKKNKLVIIND